jgi:hypothetical protein
MLLITEDRRIIGDFTRPVTTSVVIVQLGIGQDVNLSHPEAIYNLQQAKMLRLERIKIFRTDFLLIREPVPEGLFQNEGFVQWTGDGI